MDRLLFKHTIELRVRNYEVDWQGIVHNANYLLYFEVGRVEYLKHIGVKVDINTVQNDSKVVLVRNEIDYESPARFDDLLKIHSRIIYIRNSSFAFEGLIEQARDERVVAENIAVHVWLDPRTGEPTPVTDEFKKTVQKFEGMNVAIAGPSLYT